MQYGSSSQAFECRRQETRHFCRRWFSRKSRGYFKPWDKFSCRLATNPSHEPEVDPFDQNVMTKQHWSRIPLGLVRPGYNRLTDRALCHLYSHRVLSDFEPDYAVVHPRSKEFFLPCALFWGVQSGTAKHVFGYRFIQVRGVALPPMPQHYSLAGGNFTCKSN